MKDFSVEQIIQFSQTVEEESYKFYKNAGAKLEEKELKDLTEELQNAEIKHLNKLKGLLEEKKLSRKELDQQVTLQVDPQEMIVSLQPIPADATAKGILETALSREQKTESLYRQLLAFTDLSADIISTFQYLVNQEKGHVVTIEGKLKNL